MRSASSITDRSSKKARVKKKNGTVIFGYVGLMLPLAFLFFTYATSAQKVAILTPDNTEPSKAFAERLVSVLEDKLNVLDADLSLAAYQSVSPATPFNLTTNESKLIGSVIGCDFFVLLKSATQRRSAFRRNEYYEAFAQIYLVSSRTGRLVFWKNHKHEAAKPDAATKLLYDAVGALANEIVAKVSFAQKDERNTPIVPSVEEVPDSDSPLAKDFKAPIPYRRIKPEYTTEAALYGVTATVDILVDTDANGVITRTEIVRWAGFGLDESVEKTVRSMNWRPAYRDGKSLPMRFLLRYNFKTIEKEDR